jgi:hypothetical protein
VTKPQFTSRYLWHQSVSSPNASEDCSIKEHSSEALGLTLNTDTNTRKNIDLCQYKNNSYQPTPHVRSLLTIQFKVYIRIRGDYGLERDGWWTELVNGNRTIVHIEHISETDNVKYFVVKQAYWSYCNTVCMRKGNMLETSEHCNFSIGWAQLSFSRHYTYIGIIYISEETDWLKRVLNCVFRCYNRSWSLWRHSVLWTVRSLTTIYKYLRSGKMKISLYDPSRNVGSTGALILFIIFFINFFYTSKWTACESILNPHSITFPRSILLYFIVNNCKYCNITVICNLL